MPYVLIVENDEATALLLSAAVETWGYEPAIAHDAKDLSALFEKTKPWVVLLEYQLPSASGAQVLKRLRTFTGGATVPVIFVTELPAAFVNENLSDKTNVQFLEKPVDFLRLRKMVDEAMACYEKTARKDPDTGFTILK